MSKIAANVTLTDNSGLFLAALDSQIAAGLEAVGMVAETYAKRDCPVDTGRLRNSITHAVMQENGETAAIIGTNVEYGPFVELGTSMRKAKPFLGPAASGHGDEYRDIVKQAIG